MNVKQVASLVGHQNPIYALVSGAEPYFYTGGNDRGVVQWDLQKQAFVKVLAPMQHTIYTMHCMDELGLLAVGMRDGGLSLVQLSDGSLRAHLSHHDKPVFAVTSIRTAAGQMELVAASEDGTASVWDLDGEENEPALLFDFRVAEHPLRCLTISPDGSYIAFGAKDGRVHVYKTEGYELVKTLDAHTMPVTALTFSPDGNYLLSGGRDAKLNVYQTVDFSLERDFVPHLFSVYGIHYNPVLPVFATASRDKTIKIWSSEDYRLLRIISREKDFDAHKLSVNSIAWDPSGRKLLSAGDDKLVMIWELEYQ